jgi:hypothetical protein
MNAWYAAESRCPKSFMAVPLVVHTAPRNEIRFGIVKFHSAGMLFNFWAEFDDDSDIHVTGHIPYVNKTFDQLIEEIDSKEDRLIKLVEKRNAKKK